MSNREVLAQMTSFKAPLAASLACLISLSVACSRQSTGRVVRIADVGECSSQRDIILEVLPAGGLKLNSENQDREQLGSRLDEIFKTRAVRYLFVKGGPKVPFAEVAQVIDIAASHVDYVAVVTPSVMERATYKGGGCLSHDTSNDTCLNPRLPAGYITHTSQ